MNSTVTTEEILARVQMVLLPSLSALGLITNVLNLITLSRRPLRMSSCTQYFLAFSLFQLADSVTQTLFEVFSGMFQLSDTLVTRFSCKLMQFISALLPMESFGLIILASADRFCASSSSVRLRSLSNVRLARRAIIILSLVLIIYMSGFLVITDVIETPDGRICIYSTEPSAQAFSVSVVIYAAIVSPFSMVLFGVLTIYNIRMQQRRIGPAPIQNRRTDTQLTFMLIAQVGAVFIFNLPFGVLFFISAVIPEEQIANTSIELAMTFTHMWQGFSDSASFFLYTLTASVYRKELIDILRKCYGCCVHARDYRTLSII